VATNVSRFTGLLFTLCFDTYNAGWDKWEQTSGDPSGLTWNYRSITLLYNLTIALLYIVLSVTMARIVARLLNIF